MNIRIIKPQRLPEKVAAKKAVADYHASLYVDRRQVNKAKKAARHEKITTRRDAKEAIRLDAQQFEAVVDGHNRLQDNDVN